MFHQIIISICQSFTSGVIASIVNLVYAFEAFAYFSKPLLTIVIFKVMKIIYVFIVFLLCSCVGKIGKNSSQVLSSIDVVLHDSINEFDDFYDSIEMIKLDDKIPLSGVSDVQQIDSVLYVLDSRRSTVARYDLHGNYISHINKTGRGRDEYISVFSMRVDTLSKIVILTDNMSRKILLFDLNLNHLRTITTQMYPGEIAAFRSGGFLHGQASETSRKANNNELLNSSILILDSTGNAVNGFYPFPATCYTPIPYHSMSSGDKGRFFVSPALSNCVYEVDSALNNVVPVYSVNFMVDGYKILDFDSYIEMQKQYPDHSVIDMLYVLENEQKTTFAWGYILNLERSLILRFGNFNPLICVYDKVHGTSKSYFTNDMSAKNGLALVFAFPLSSHGNDLYAAMDVGTLKSFARVEKLPDHWKQEFAALDDTANPIIFRYTVK